MNTESIANEGIAEIVARVAGAMEAAVKDYGPDAVDLALLAYRVDAIQSLATSALCLGAAVGLGFAYKWLWHATENIDRFDRPFIRGFSGFIGGAAGLLLSIAGTFGLLYAPNWAAAFGYPELLIATKALRAAGLM